MKKIFKLYFLIQLLLICFSSCDFLITDYGSMSFSYKEIQKVKEDETEESEPEPVKKEWTLFIYMCADNNLESAMIEDLNEMEWSNLDTDKVNVIALVDRSPLYNTSNENWDNSRLFLIKTKKDKSVKTLISEEIDCEALNLKKNSDVELDMSDKSVLSESIKFVRNEFLSEKFGLVIWGHGNGWRNEDSLLTENVQSKGFAYDDSSGKYMSLKDLRLGIESVKEDEKLDFIGFDTCFGGLLETVYEIRELADYAVGSESLIPTEGWNYQNIFNNFENIQNKTSEALCKIIVEQFKNQYESSQHVSIAAAKLEEVKTFFDLFNEITQFYSDLIVTSEIRDEVMNLIYSKNESLVENYTYGGGGSDIYLDCCSLIEELFNYFENKGDFLVDKRTSYYAQYISNINKFYISKNRLIFSSWASDREEGGLGVFFATLKDSYNLSVTHPDEYVRGRTKIQLDFVNDCTGYVPEKEKGTSLLDNLFYTNN